MFEPRPEMSTATRFLAAGLAVTPSPSKVEPPAKPDPGIATLFDYFAELHDGFPIGCKEIGRRARGSRLQHRNHTNAAVKGAQHFLLADVAGMRKPLEYRGHGHARQIQLDRKSGWQHARNIFDETASGNMGQRLYSFCPSYRGKA